MIRATFHMYSVIQELFKSKWCKLSKLFMCEHMRMISLMRIFAVNLRIYDVPYNLFDQLRWSY